MNGRARPELQSGVTLLPLQATNVQVPVLVRQGKGIPLDFQAPTGEAFLNGMQIKRRC